MAESHILQLDIVIVMDIGHIDTHLTILLSLQAFRECHRLSLHLAEGVECRNGLHTFVSRKDGGERAVSIILELLDSHTTAKAATTRQLARMVEEIAVTIEVGYTTVVGKRLGLAQRHNLASISPRTCGRWGCAIRDVLRHTTSGIQQEIAFSCWLLAISLRILHQPRALRIAILVFLAPFTLVHSR